MEEISNIFGRIDLFSVDMEFLFEMLGNIIADTSIIDKQCRAIIIFIMPRVHSDEIVTNHLQM